MGPNAPYRCITAEMATIYPPPDQMCYHHLTPPQSSELTVRQVWPIIITDQARLTQWEENEE